MTNEGETKYMKISSNITYIEQNVITELQVFIGTSIIYFSLPTHALIN